MKGQQKYPGAMPARVRASASAKPSGVSAGSNLSILRTFSHNAKPTDRPMNSGSKPAHVAPGIGGGAGKNGKR